MSRIPFGPSKSNLLTRTGKLVGVGRGPHPFDPKRKHMEFFVYQLAPMEFCICLSEAKGRGKDLPERCRKHLGMSVPGSAFAKFAERHLEGLPYKQVVKVLTEAFTNVEAWLWHEEQSK